MTDEEVMRQDILNIADCVMSITNELYESHGLAFNDVRFRLEGIIKRYEVQGGPEKDPLGGAGNYLDKTFNKPLDPINEINKLVMESKSLRSRNEELVSVLEESRRYITEYLKTQYVYSGEKKLLSMIEDALKENKGE